MAEGDFNVKAIISANTSQFEQGMKNAQNSLSDVSKSIDGVSKLLKSAFSVVGITASVGAVINFGKNAVAAADSANKQFNILSNTIKATGASAWTSTEELDKMAKDYAKATNYSVGQIEDMQSVLLGFRNITGKTFGDASDAIMDMATVMGMDLKSATQTVGKALDDPVKGLDSLRRQGFAFTEEQKMELEQLVRNGKQLEAQKIILDELATTYGGAAKAGVSATNTWQYSITNLTETIGNKLMPYVEQSSKTMAKFADSIAEGLNTKSFDMVVNSIKLILETGSKIVKMFVEPFIKGIQDITKELSKLDIESYFDVFDGVIGVVKFVFDEIISIIKYTFNNIKRSITYFVEFFNSGFAKRIKDIVLQVVDMIVFLYQQIRDIFVKIKDFIQQKQDELINSISNASSDFFNLDTFLDGVEEVLNSAFRMFQDLINGVKALFSGDFSLALDYGKLALYRLADTWMTSISTILNSMPNLVNGVINGINKIIDGINKVREWMGQDPLGLIGAFESVDLSQSLGIDEKIDELERKIKEKTGSAADYSIKEIKRTTKAFSGATKNVISEIGKTGNSAQKESKETSDDVQKDTKNTEKSTSKILKNIGKAWAKLSNDIEKDAEDWSDVTTVAYTTMKDVGSGMFEALGEGLASGEVSFQDYGAAAVSAIAEVLKSLSAQLTAMAVAAAMQHDYARAAMGAAGAAAALAAAGALSAVASQMKSTASSSKEASDEITAVGDAAKNTQSSLEKFLEKINQIREGFSASSEGVVQFVLSSKRAYADGTSSLNEYLNKIRSIQGEMDSVRNQLNKWGVGDSIEKADELRAQGVNYEYYMPKYIYRELNKYYDAQKRLNETVNEYNEYMNKLREVQESINNIYAETRDNLRTQINDNKELISLYEELYNWTNRYTTGIENSTITKTRFDMLFNEQFLTIQQTMTNFYGNLSKVGENIGDILFSSLEENTTKNDFLKNLRDYFKTNLLKISVYTESFQSRLAELGTKLSTSFAMGGSNLKQIKKEISDLWDTTKKGAKEVENMIAEVFSEIREEVEITTEEIGTSIFDNLVSALSDGLTQGEFLENMKKYIRDMLIQTLVYTQSMKNEIEAIGKAISEGLTTGFSETSLHEIRRDLSYIFNEANKTMAGLDSVLDNVFSGYANGTQNATSGLHLVGEAGPELVRFRGGEQVLNASETRGVLENAVGNTNNFNVTFNNLQDTSAYAMMSQLREYNREMAINGVI